MAHRPALRGIDLFASLNVTIALAMAFLVYYDRFAEYRGPANVWEFFVYAIVIASAFGILWYVFRDTRIPLPVLAFVQIGILMHFAGGFVPIGGDRLYDAYLLGVRFDKYVHLVNGLAVGAVVTHLFRSRGLRLDWFHGWLMVFTVLGLGTIIEIFEFIVVTTFTTDTGVGNYHNNMLDLVANLAGALICLATVYRHRMTETRSASSPW